MSKHRRQTFADDFQGEIDRVDGRSDGKQRQTFASDFEQAARRMGGRRKR